MEGTLGGCLDLCEDQRAVNREHGFSVEAAVLQRSEHLARREGRYFAYLRPNRKSSHIPRLIYAEVAAVAVNACVCNRVPHLSFKNVFNLTSVGHLVR